MINMCSLKVPLLMFCTTLLVLLVCTNTGEKHPSSTLSWQILNPPIVFGKDVELYCNASYVENCCNNTAVWMRDFDVIIHHSASTDSSKYIPKQYSDGFSLVIKNFNEDDVNHQYTCLYDFFHYSEDLKLNASFMIYWPNKEELKINTTLSDNMIVADIMFDRVYPSPECIFVVNGESTATNVTITEKSRSRLFYKMKINLVSEINQIKNINSVTINCTVGGYDMVVMENSSFDFTDSNTSSFSRKESTETTTSISITLAFILILCTAAVMILIIWKNKAKTCKRKIIEGIDLQSTCSEMNCALVGWRPFTNISEESEMILLLPMHSLSGTSHKNLFSTIAKTQQVVESNRLIFRVILEFNAFVEALNTKKRIKGVRYDTNNLKDENDINVGNTKPLLCSPVYRSSNDVKRWNRSSIHPAQKMKDVARIVIYACLHDYGYIQGLATNIGINLARCRAPDNGLNSFTCFPLSATRTSDTWVIGPAQKVRDVIRIVHYFALHDKLYIQKLVTNTKINYARTQRSISSKITSSSVPDISNESTANMADVINASSFIPNWGIKKRCRVVSLTHLNTH